MSATDKLAALRHLLAELFPAAPRTHATVLPTGIATLDEEIGGLPRRAITEIIPVGPSCGSQLLLGQLLAVTRTQQRRVALIDGCDQFDPASSSPDLLAHVVWVRCRSLAEALSAADLIVRDANFSLALLDLRGATARELHRIPATFWYRLQRAVEQTDLALVITTPHACVPSAQLRLELGRPAEFHELEAERPALLAQLLPVVLRQRRAAIATG
ncbi:MAG: hypothetical protein Q8J74_10880 [Candidatus Didemnitutus sp.]|nr:hypothetical protein [Candidatus Didemnitutus sp.]